jgi:hypothetical protein
MDKLPCTDEPPLGREVENVLARIVLDVKFHDLTFSFVGSIPYMEPSLLTMLHVK